MADRKEIETILIGKQKMYNVEKYLKNKNIEDITIKDKKKICYCRVSSKKQEGDLNNQIEMMQKLYSTYEIIKDIGSGLNYERKGLKKILKYSLNGELEVLVIAYKDRLVRFGYELIENIINEKNGKIIIINNTEEKTPVEELSLDLVSIMNVYVAKVNGLRKYKKLMTESLKRMLNFYIVLLLIKQYKNI